jgi:hypothetical protein
MTLSRAFQGRIIGEGMNWFDIFLLIAIAAITALGIRRKLVGALVGLAVFPLMRIFMVIGNPWIGVLMAVLAGILVGFLGRNLLIHKRGFDIPLMVLGGVGGLFTGLLFVGLMITSLPINYDKVNNTYIYPPKFNVNPILRQAFQESRFVDVGRDILLYPLLDQAGQVPAGQRGTYKALHNVLVVGEPWERSQEQ